MQILGPWYLGITMYRPIHTWARARHHNAQGIEATVFIRYFGVMTFEQLIS